MIASPASTFDEQRQAVAAAIETQPESAILALLKAGIEEGKPTQAIAEARKWLRQNLPKDDKLLLQAGRAAELSGDAAGAAALYQQYLKLASPDADGVRNAVIAVHVLLRDQLKDVTAAYSFNRISCGRLIANVAVRQFDPWFIGEAIQRGDVIAVADRLRVICEADISLNVLVHFYEPHFRWLLQQVSGYIDQGGKARMTPELAAACKNLAKAMRHHEELALQLDWAAAVASYNLAMLAEQNVAPPIGEAKALLAKYPHHALWVQNGWAGGGNGPYYRGDPAKYWPHEIDAKMAPIVAAAAKLNPLQLADLMASWRNGYYADRATRPLDVAAVLDFIRSAPQRMNSRNGLLFLEKAWNQFTPGEAAALAPGIAANEQEEASLIRAIAAGGEGRDFDKMADALLGPEVWRLDPSRLPACVDQLWHYAGNTVGVEKRDQRIAEGNALAQRAKEEVLPNEAPPAQHTALFQKLWADYRSPQPKIPGVLGRLQAVVKLTPDAVPALLRDGSPEALLLARNTIASGFAIADPVWQELETHVGINVWAYAPMAAYLAQRHAYGNIEELKRRLPNKCRPHPLEPALRQAVADGLKRNDLDPWQFTAWINMQFSEDNAGQVKLVQELASSPLWNGMPWEARFAAFQWFGKDLMTQAQVAMIEAADPARVCKELLGLERKPETAEEKKAREEAAQADPDAAAAKAAEIAKADVAAATAALQSTLDGLRKAPVRIEVPGAALENLATLDPAVFGDATALERMLQLIDGLKAAAPTPNFANRLLEVMERERDPLKLHCAAPFLWENVNRHVHSFPRVKVLSQSLIEDQPSAASALAEAGLNAIARHRGHSYFNRDVDVPLFKSIRGNAAMKMGLIVIPVAPNHPAYPVYQSQGDWTIGNEDSAWARLDANWEAFVEVHRELSVTYLLWVLQQTIYTRADERQETLVKSLLEWTREDGNPLSAVEKIRIELAYGDIAIQRGQLRQALEIFTRTYQNEAWQDVPLRYQAALRGAGAERLAKNFEGALQALSQLETERIPELWADIRYARAEVRYDMEEFEDAKDDIDSIVAREPNHPDARILLGKIQLKREKLMEATEVELGSNTGQDSIVPGEKLKVTLSDPTLAVSGAGTEIEVKVWATSGDEEQFFLRQFGDQKTKFRGEIATALGESAKDDGTLQVIGDDQIFYAYTERFLQKMNQVDERRGGPLTVASDALLIASARKLLTEAEQRTADMEAVMTELAAKGQSENLEEAAKARLAVGAMDVASRAGSGELTADEFGRYLVNVAKPGNPIHVRVIDPDRSRTAGVDELMVSVSSSSGDSISQVTLKETGTHTGWFEASIPTAGAQALAFSPNSEPGRNPNMVISPTAGYPAWRALVDDDPKTEFVIDLNDNVALGELTLTAAETGAALKSFALETGLHDADMTTIAAYPRHLTGIEKPWHPSVVVINDTDHHHERNERSVYSLDELQQQLARGWMAQNFAAGAAGNVVGPSEAMTQTIPGKVEWKRQNRHHNAHVIYRFRGYFHEPRDVIRRFKLELGHYQVPEGTHSSVAHPPQFLLAVNGRPITNPEMPDRLEGEINLRPGIHHFEIWATGWDCAIGFGRDVRLLANLDEPDAFIACPDAFFDPASFPEQSMDHRNPPATLSASPDGTKFTVKFAEGSRARLLKLVILDQEGPVPALNKITLNQPDGGVVLPVAEDFSVLNRNETLEMLPGDKISVRYVDDRFVTEAKERHERFLDVAFTDARIEFADIEPRWSERHRKVMPYYERLLRFEYDKPLSLVVTDPDMDVSGEPDTVRVTLRADRGEPREFQALETGDSTGIFKLLVTPVAKAGAAKDALVVSTAGSIAAAYLDEENNRPGVPYERLAAIDHAAFATPQFSLAHAEVQAWEPEEGQMAMATLRHGFEVFDDRESDENQRLASEVVRPRFEIRNRLLPATEVPDVGFAAIHGRHLQLEVVAPHLALRSGSNVTVHAQTEAGRRAGGAAQGAGFDISIPGTIEIGGQLGMLPATGVPEIPTYVGGGVWSLNEALPNDRFRLSIPLVAGVLPASGVLSEQEREDLKQRARDSRAAAAELQASSSGLVVQPGDTVHLGFRYRDPEGRVQWLTASTKVVTHGVFDLMTEDYRQPMTSAYVGETLNLRVVDLGADVSDAMDTVNVTVQAKSGARAAVELRESGPHTGIFKGTYLISYAQQAGALPEGYNVRQDGFPVIYGDTIAARYTDTNGVHGETHMVTISKGADGLIQPFSKTYENEEIGMKTQFSLAEAYLEMAKRHRQLGENDKAELEYSSAKLLLSKAMDEFRDPDTRAHAEYLLGTLTMEEAIAATDPETRETRFRAALSRFMTVTGSYPETIHASRAQYRSATVYEAIGEPDIAAQEYVKLAYKYPDSEFLATSMLRLGSHFLKTAGELEAKARGLLAKGEDDKDAQYDGAALLKLAHGEYLKTASIFGRLQERFPSNELAGPAGLRAGQAYMRAEKNAEAVDAFQRVIAEEGYDGPKVRAQAMYWAGMSYQNLRQEMAAYSTFKRLTYDFPESEWAAYARAQLSSDRLLNLETQLELERLEAGQ